jgi:glucokinase
MNTENYPRLLGDIGGTNARFSWQERRGDPLTAATTYACANHVSLTAAIRYYLADHSKGAPRYAGIGIATPVTGDYVQMTNHHWSFSIAGMQQALGLRRLVVMNDFTALALALPALKSSEMHQIGSGTAAPEAALAVIGPGTGLGVAGLIPTELGNLVPITGEGGHVSLAASDALESKVVDRLKQRFGHASAERALSGPGLVNLYEAACSLSGQTVQALDPADVIALARSAQDASCVMALDLFFKFLGGVAGDMALTFGARGGVYIGGGIAPRLLPELQSSAFRERFESKGRFQGYLSKIPTFLIDTAVSPAFIGVNRALDLNYNHFGYSRGRDSPPGVGSA